MSYSSIDGSPGSQTRLILRTELLQGAQSPGRMPSEAFEANFHVRKIQVKARLTAEGLSFEPSTRLGKACPWSRGCLSVAYEDVLGSEVSEVFSCLAVGCCQQVHVLVVHAIRRHRKLKHLWRRQRIRLSSQDGDLAKQIWAMQTEPLFRCAGISVTVIETEREAHAREVVELMEPTDIERLDGIVAVGGDGVFQEILNGLLHLRQSQNPAVRDAARSMRLGHVPAGSTDAVAYSIHGTRDALTAALHIALGDRLALDIMRVDTLDSSHRYATCVASYGYMGDLMHTSERLRWMGPGRYNIAGALTLAMGRSYNAKVSFLPATTGCLSQQKVCYADCEVCNEAAVPSSPNAYMRPSMRAQSHQGWQVREGRYKSIMAVLMPCRSDRSTLGLAPYSHLADGRLQLILVRQCSRLQYLRFLASIPVSGVQDGRFSFVEVVEATAVQVHPVGQESWWNVDGELLQNNHMTAEVHRGLISVFARGIEH
ncbi:hypothetical protein WJX73_007417 [Symbiochloris irregularis]|uniref:DAGKc domain-containing protein n=1 Tax=Symbiochloris irregularis TaxID=706552 RepID=A0AAW1PUY8_9CHLO